MVLEDSWKQGRYTLMLFCVITERIRSQMMYHKLGDASQPVTGPTSADTHMSQDNKDSADQTMVIKPLPPKTSASVPSGEHNPNSGKNLPVCIPSLSGMQL